jgi:hypothetical protein
MLGSNKIWNLPATRYKAPPFSMLFFYNLFNKIFMIIFFTPGHVEFKLTE